MKNNSWEIAACILLMPITRKLRTHSKIGNFMI